MSRDTRLDPLTILPRYLAILVCLTIPAPRAGAADAAEGPHKAGAWALEFEIDPTYSSGIGYVASAAISVKRHSSERRAWRLGMAVTFSETEFDGESSQYRYSVYYNPLISNEQGSTDSHNEDHVYRLFLHAVRHYPVREQVAVFLEVGPSLRYDEVRRSQQSLYPYGLGETYAAQYAETRRGATLDANVGFEWFFSKRLSLGGRYGAYAGYQWGTRSSGLEIVRTDGSYYSRSTERGRVRRVDVSTTRATILLTAYL